MVWTVGSVTISPGARLGHRFTWSSDPHAQHIVPNPLNPGGLLRIDELSKEQLAGGSVRYRVFYTNIGSVATNLNFQGGGLT
jgi:hypothetical protein